MMVNDNSKQLRAHRKVDYFEEFSDGDQEDYEAAVKEVIFKLPVKRQRSKKKVPSNEVDNEENKAKNGSVKHNNKRTKDKCSNNTNGKDKEKDKGQKEILDSIIVLSELRNHSSVSNSDIMLCLLELCLNSEKYGITLDNSSRGFWENVSHNDELFHAFKQFKPETLRKYWRRMRLTYKYKKLVEVIKSNQQKLNNEDLKLLSAINAVCDYILSPSKGLDAYIQKYSIKKVKKTLTAEEHKNKNKNETDNEEESQDNLVNVYHLDCISEMVELLSKCYPNLLKAIIYQKLIEVSGNIENAYLYIKNPELYSYFAFLKEEDEIIKSNDENSEQYKTLFKKKGYDLMNQRKMFLFN